MRRVLAFAALLILAGCAGFSPVGSVAPALAHVAAPAPAPAFAAPPLPPPPPPRSPAPPPAAAAAPRQAGVHDYICPGAATLRVRYAADRRSAAVRLDGRSEIALDRNGEPGAFTFAAAGGARLLASGTRAVFFAAPATIVVAPGDTLGSIAQRRLGSAARAADIVRANAAAIADPNLIRVGQTLVLPAPALRCVRALGGATRL